MQPSNLPAGLPAPHPDSLAHSRRVAAWIAARVEEAGGAITFGEYMHHALYAPGLGYYASGTTKFGADGDFITAPETSPLFGRVVAQQAAQVLATVAHPQVIELGAGSGALAVQVLGALDELGRLPERYAILEVSADLAERQRRLIAERLPELVGRVEWLEQLPAGVEGVILANEVADALPVERFRVTPGGVEQQFVTVTADAGFLPEWRKATAAVQQAVAALELPASFESDISLALRPWVGSLVRSLERGVALLFDYGVSRREYYAPDRSGGWLRCHFRHHVHEQPFVLPGVQDLSAWVDFSAVAEAASEAGAAIAGYTTQAMFLLQGGLDDAFAAASRALQPGQREQLELAQQVKRLTLPTEMGENFKCIGLTRGDAPRLSAFAGGDRAAAL